MRALVIDASGNIYVAGANANGFLDDNSGIYRGKTGYVARASGIDGALVWSHRLGIDDGMPGVNVMVDSLGVNPAGEVYGAGAIEGAKAIEGTPAGGADAIAFKLDPATGAFVWKHQLGTLDNDFATALAVKPNGDLVVVGYTFGRLDGGSLRGVAPRKCNSDLFVTIFRSDGGRR